MAIGGPNLYPEAPPCPDVAAHQQKISHSYVVVYPAHEPRAHDPHRHDFLAWKQDRKTGNTWYCDFAREHRNGDESECDTTHPLEAHHKILELAMVNEVDFALLEEDYPGVSNPDLAGAWIDSDKNLTLLCVNHHRGPMGVHCASASDFGSEAYVRNLIQARLPYLLKDDIYREQHVRCPDPGFQSFHDDPRPFSVVAGVLVAALMEAARLDPGASLVVELAC